MSSKCYIHSISIYLRFILKTHAKQHTICSVNFKRVTLFSVWSYGKHGVISSSDYCKNTRFCCGICCVQRPARHDWQITPVTICSFTGVTLGNTYNYGLEKSDPLNFLLHCFQQKIMHRFQTEVTTDWLIIKMLPILLNILHTVPIFLRKLEQPLEVLHFRWLTLASSAKRGVQVGMRRQRSSLASPP